MSCEIAVPPVESKPSVRAVFSYDTGYEHSIEHLAEVRRMVEEDQNAPLELETWLPASKGILLDLKAS